VLFTLKDSILARHSQTKRQAGSTNIQEMKAALWVFTAISYVSSYLAVVFALLCLAMGVIYVSELMEEYPTLSKQCLRYTIYIVNLVHILLWLCDGFPFFHCLAGFIAHVVYAQMLWRYPDVSLISARFLSFVIALIATNWIWIQYFKQFYFSFGEVLGFFLVCVWLVPVLFIISLNVEDTSLPYSSASLPSAGSGAGAAPDAPSFRLPGHFSFKSVIATVRSKLFGTGTRMRRGSMDERVHDVHAQKHV